MSFRSVINFIDGYGIVWNYGERIQVFTHPLWFFVLSVAHLFSGGFIWPGMLSFSSIFLSLFFCLCTLWIYMKGVRGLQLPIVLIFLLALFSSQAFLDYTTSGLENALSYFLISACCYLLFFRGPSLLFFFLCAGLFLNRVDYTFLLLPMSLYVWREAGYRLSVIFLPVFTCILWLLFSTWYFGFPFPNTSIAKLNINAPLWNFIQQGFRYYKLTLLRDPITLFIIFSVILFSFYDIFRYRCLTKIASVGLGLLFYGLYIVWIGGDFMRGRFFSIPFLYALCGFSFLLKSRDFQIDFKNINFLHDFLGVKGLVFFAMSLVFIFSSVSIFINKTLDNAMIMVDGIANERYWYKDHSIGLRDLVSFSGNVPTLVEVSCCPGGQGVSSTGNTYIVDPIALSSPYLSRVAGRWDRIGHMPHLPPTDFTAWVIGAAHHLPDPSVDRYFSDIREVVRGDLFSLSRIKKIISINFVDYKLPTFSAVEQRFSRFYPSLQKQIPLLSMGEVNQGSWRNAKVRWFSEKIVQSISINFTRHKLAKVSLPVDGFRGYSWSLYDGTKKVYKDSFVGDKFFSFHTFSLPRIVWADRLELTIDGKSYLYRRMGRPILE